MRTARLLRVQRAVCLLIKKKEIHLEPENEKYRQSPLPKVPNPKIGIKQKGRLRKKKVLSIYRVLLQLQVRYFCRQMFSIGM